jgi:hypothetical protein
MKTHRVGSVSALRILAAARAVGLVGITLASLGGCADTHWERALYQGARYGGEQCQLKRNPTDAPCAALGDYDRYAQERAKARNASPPSVHVDAIEETQR